MTVTSWPGVDREGGVFRPRSKSSIMAALLSTWERGGYIATGMGRLHSDRNGEVIRSDRNGEVT